MEKIEFEPTGAGNYILSTDWGRVSYNPNTATGHMGIFITHLLNDLGQNVEDGEETALYADDIWMILTGDFRKEYLEAFPNKKKCIAVYKKYKKKFRNNYSTD